MEEEDLESFILELHEKQALKFEDVVLKTGVVSPVYVDLRVLVSYPELTVCKFTLE